MMILAKDLKRIINQIPDDLPVLISGSWDCNIEGVNLHFDGDQSLADLKLTDGFGLVANDFVDSLFNDIKKLSELASERGRYAMLRQVAVESIAISQGITDLKHDSQSGV